MLDPSEAGIRDGAILERLSAELDLLRDASQLRTVEILRGINLCSNDYLGLASDPRLRHAVTEAVAKTSAVGSTGSRLLSGNSLEWERLESSFAAFAGTEAALYFGSGYAANVGLLSSLLKPGDTVFSDALNHASLIDGIRLSGARKVIYPHRDVHFLEKALREDANRAGARVIVTETVFSMEGDVAPVTEMLALARQYGAKLVIDEAHATGVYGPEGSGIAAEIGIAREALAIVHTCGKALASAGAFVCGTNTLRDYLVNRARTFIFSTAMPPYLALQIQSALELARAADPQREHLRKIARELREGLAAARINCGTSTTQIVPVIVGSNEMALHVASELQRQGFAAKAIRPPTVPPGGARVRISLTSKIAVEDVRRLASLVAGACNSAPEICSAAPANV